MLTLDEPLFRILCVDDDRRTRQAIMRGFGEHGFEVVTAAPGSDALMQFQAEGGDFGAILIDPGSSRANGAEFIKQVRALGYQGRVLIMAESMSASECAAYQECAVSGFLSKPFEISMVATMLLQAD